MACFISYGHLVHVSSAPFTAEIKCASRTVYAINRSTLVPGPSQSNGSNVLEGGRRPLNLSSGRSMADLQVSGMVTLLYEGVGGVGGFCVHGHAFPPLLVVNYGGPRSPQL